MIYELVDRFKYSMDDLSIIPFIQSFIQLVWLIDDGQIMEFKGKEDKSFNLFTRLVGWFIVKLIWRSWGFMQSTR